MAFRNNTYVTHLARFNPDPYAAAGQLSGTGTNADANNGIRAANAGYPVNLFVVNPDLLGGVNIVENTIKTMYHAVYALPFGRGQKFGSGANGFVDRVLGGWQLSGNARMSSGRLFDLGNVRLVGMDKSEVQKLFKLRITDAGRMFMFPQEIIDETFKAFSVSGTSASGYGSLGPRAAVISLLRIVWIASKRFAARASADFSPWF
jgi:hypothetical protein